MNKIKIFLSIAVLTFGLFNIQGTYSQMKFNAGIMRCNIDGDTISFDLKTDQNNLYFMAMGGTADVGLIKIQWDDKTPAEVKTQTLKMDKGFVENREYKISLIWGDFYTNLPYIIQKGTLTITENANNTIKGTLEINAELGGSSIIGEFIKGKKETVLRDGRFEIWY